MITLDNVSFQYPDQTVPVFSNFSIEFPPGKVTVILGPNGCGKSTLFHLAYGWLQPITGNLQIANQQLRNLSRQEMGRQIAILPQSEKAPFQLSVMDYVLLGRTPYQNFLSKPSEEDQRIAQGVIGELQIKHLQKKLVAQLSGGEQQLVFIARVLTQNTPLILLDEITTHLDLYHIKIIFSLIKQMKSDGKTILMTMHDPNLSAVIADEIVLLLPDATYIQGTLSQVMTSANLSKVFTIIVPVTKQNDHFAIDWKVLLEL